MNRWTLLALLILFGGGSWIWISRLPPETVAMERQSGVAIGQAAPNFELTTIEGEPFDLAALQGKPVVLNFWATWCGPCRRELPALQASAERYSEEVVIVGVDQGETPETVQPFIDELGLTFIIPMDTTNTVSAEYGVRGLPTTFFIDSDGIIQRVWSGEMNSITLAESIVELLE